MSTCGVCKRPLDTGNVEDRDCGGDCLECMGDAGDPAASKAFIEEVRYLRKLAQRLHSDNVTLRANMGGIDRLLEQRTPLGVQGARRIAQIYARMNDTPQVFRPKKGN